MEFQRGFTVNNLNTDFVQIMSEVRDTYYNNSINSNGTYGTKTATGNSRIYNCTHCERAFTREEHLSRHITSTHTKSKPFVCGICSRPFSRRDLLLRHAKSLHKGSEVAISRIRKSYKKSQDDAKEGEQEGPESDDSNSPSNSSLSDVRDVKMSVKTLVS